MYKLLTICVLLYLIQISTVHSATTALKVSTAKVNKGTTDPTTMTALGTQDQSGTQNDYTKYVEFTPATGANFEITLTYVLPTSVSASSVTGLSLVWNYLGPDKADMRWSWAAFNAAKNTFDYLVDNALSTSGFTRWFLFTTPVPLTYLNSNQIVLKFYSNNSVDACDIDYCVINVTYSGTSSPTPSPATTPTPTPSTPRTPTPTPSTPTPTPTKTPTPTPSTPTPTPTKTPTPTIITPTPTKTPTPTPSPSPSPSSGNWWKPAPRTTWQWQLTGTIDTSFNVQMYDIDLFDAPVATISLLKGQGKKVICYFSGGTYEDWRSDASSFTSVTGLLGNTVCKTDSCDTTWAGERWLDVRKTTDLTRIMGARLDLAVSKGCDGVEPDNMDAYANTNGFPLTATDQLNYNKLIANLAHTRGLSVGLKNDLGQITSLVSSFDWALNEECNEFGECASLTPFITAGKAVFGTEYELTGKQFCPQSNAANFSTLKKSYDLDAPKFDCLLDCIDAACTNGVTKRGVIDGITIDDYTPLRWAPAPGLTWHFQLQGVLESLAIPGVDVYVLDMFDYTAKTFTQLKSNNKKIVCHFSAGTLENWRPDAKNFPAAIVGNSVPGAAGEKWLNISDDAIKPLMLARLQRAKSKGCDAVSVDYVDLWENNPSPFTINRQLQLDYLHWLSDQSHTLGLAIGFTNNVNMADDLISTFDFAINEQCFEYKECDKLANFSLMGKPVFGVEYKGSMESFCPQTSSYGWDWIKKTQDVGYYGINCRNRNTSDISVQISGDMNSASSVTLSNAVGDAIAKLSVRSGTLTQSSDRETTISLKSSVQQLTQVDVYMLTGDSPAAPFTVCMNPQVSNPECLMVYDSVLDKFTCVNNSLVQDTNQVLWCSDTTSTGTLAIGTPSQSTTSTITPTTTTNPTTTTANPTATPTTASAGTIFSSVLVVLFVLAL